jgi:hypothetical protein
MKIQSLIVVSLLSFFCTAVYAEQATGLCKDGTAWTGPSKRGACRGHKGVQEWYADKQSAPAAAAPAPAQAPAASAPAAAAQPASGPATGTCKDGTTWTGPSKRGACRGHKGVKEWFADKQSAPATSTPAAAPTPAAPGTSVSGTATGLCKDGTEYTGSSKRGACRGHKGLQEWYADKQSAPAPATAPDTATAPAAPATAAPAAAPSAAATGICKDGTEYTGASKRGACRGHKGLKEWFGDKTAAPATVTTPATTPAPSAATTAPAATPAQTAQPATAAPAATVSTATAAPTGQVWVNTNSKIYHCPGSKFFGKTKEGEYMEEAQAQAKGFVPNRKKTCGLAR